MTISAKRTAGFTLIELMIAVVVAAILASLAIPAYNSYIRKARRTEAKSALLDMASSEERFFTTNNAYTQDPTVLGYAAPPPGGPLITLASGYYIVAQPGGLQATPVPLPPAPFVPAFFQITITANPATDQVNDTQCASFTVDSTGSQTSKDANSVDSTATCWR